MPATEQTWRDTKRMHVIFGVSSLALLLTTIWMLVADHNRPWKPAQREFRIADARFSGLLAMQQETAGFLKQVEDLEEALLIAQSGPVSAQVLDQFQAVAAEQMKKWDVSSADSRLNAVKEARVKLPIDLPADASITAVNPDDDPTSIGTPTVKLAGEGDLHGAYYFAFRSLDDSQPSGTLAPSGVYGFSAAKKASVAYKNIAKNDDKTRQVLRSRAGDKSRLFVDATVDGDETEATSKHDDVELRQDAIEARQELLDAMADVIKAIKFIEDDAARAKKETGSKRDAARSEYDIATRDSLDNDVAQQRLRHYEDMEKEVADLDKKVREVKAARTQLDELLKLANQPVENAKKAVDDQRKELVRFHKAQEEREPNIGKSVVEAPILEAFNSPIRPDQIWLPDLKIKFPLNNVARFDRCMTCHQGMIKNIPGEPTMPAFPPERLIPDLAITPKAAPENDKGERPGATIEAGYGMKLAPYGLIDEDAVTIVVFPGSLAAQKGLKTADVLVAVDGAKVVDRDAAKRLLVDAVNWDNPREIALEVRRGLPQPYSAHPRLDLFGTDSSPHAFGKIGCTICHEGQGTATAFQHAEHAPDTVAEEDRWRREYKWFENHYWDWPQKPLRFIESSCLKCHHDVAELRASERFPDPPAPKLTRGYDLVREYGCFGCHEVRGYAGPDVRIGPDLRIEPDYYAWAIKLKQEIGPKIAELRPQVDAILKDEFAKAAERDAIDARKKEATAANQAEQVAQLDAQFMRLDGEVKALTAKRLAIESRLNELSEISNLAERVRTSPEDSQVRTALSGQLASDADRPKRKEFLDSRRGELVAVLSKSKQALKEAQDQKNAAKTAEIKPQVELMEVQLKSIDERIAGIEPTALSTEVTALADRFRDIESPGTMRKVGPSLRFVGAKVDGAFLHDWISDPKNFRPSTKMPRVFGQYDHLDKASVEKAKKLEEVEIQGIVAFLLDRSQDYSYLPPPEMSAEQATESAARGRELFVTRGCIACHMIENEGREPAEGDKVAETLAKAHEDQGPDLSRIGAKLAAGAKESGRDPQKWLYTWLRDPSRYHARTKMPNMKLDPVPVVDAAGMPQTEMRDGEQVTQTTDPAADIAAYLLSLGGWTPREYKAVSKDDVNDLARQHLGQAYRDSEIDAILASGIKRDKSTLKGDEKELAVGDRTATEQEMDERKLLYVGRRAISKYGCFGCHDVPDFEDAKPIGTGLADWGRKEVDKLAFEQIGKYVGHGHGHGHGDHDEHGHGDHDHAHDHSHGAKNGRALTEAEKLDAKKRDADDHDFLHHQLLHGSRAGFLWQKLREPRSYDYKKTETKTYNEWLRMPKFTFPENEDDVEAVMTFILGLVAEPPEKQYLYAPAPRQKAIMEGLTVLEKFNCAGCHVLRPETISVSYEPSRPGQPSPFKPADPYAGYDFTRPHTPADALAASTKEGYTGRAKAVLRGLPSLERTDPREYLVLDHQGTVYEPDPTETEKPQTYLPFLLWEPAVIDGQAYHVGAQPTNVPTWLIDRRTPAWGGTAARLMMPLAFEKTRAVRQDLTGDGTWAIVPPPLLRQGEKTQGDWLHDFLLDPHPIRPAVVLRMPKFNMSDAEAQKLVAYFAAVDNVEKTYEFEPRTRDEYVVSTGRGQPTNGKQKGEPDRLEKAFNLAANVCSRCHNIGDFTPAGHDAAKAPNLDRIHARMRPEYLRPWLANPPSVLPYTNMPVNFPHDGLVNQQVLPGSSREQLEAVTDLLLNYDRVMKEQAGVAERVKKLAPPPMTDPAAAPAAAPTNPPATDPPADPPETNE